MTERTTEPRSVEDAARFAAEGVLVGDSAAAVRIVEFVDFECRYCRRMQPILAELLTRQPQSVALVYRHFPLSLTGFALPAAIAAECASMQGRFASFSDSLFASQDSLARLSMEALALQAGVLDTARFRTCQIEPAARERVHDDIRAGRRLGVTATPTFLIGERVYAGELSSEKLNRLVRDELVGRNEP